MTKKSTKPAPELLTRKKRLASFVARKKARGAPCEAKRLNASALAEMPVTADDTAGDGVFWVVANSPPGDEFRTQNELVDAGFRCYVITATVWHTPDVVRGVRPQRKLVTRPLLPRMLFIGVRGPVDAVFETIKPDVAKSADDRPGGVLVVPGHILREFVTRVGVADPVVLLRDHARFVVGQRVEVASGPLAGQSGNVTSVKSKRVKVGVKILGTITDAEFSVDSLRESA